MDSYGHPMTPTEAHYPQHQHPSQVQQQPQTARQSQWPPHLLSSSQTHGQSSFPSPGSSTSGLGEQPYSAFYHTDNPIHGHQHLHRSSSSLSLNLSSLSVASPTNLSPINPPSAVSSTLSPITPISPSSTLQNSFSQHMQHPFQFNPPERSQNQGQPQSQSHSPATQYDDHQHQQSYTARPLTTPLTSASRSSSSSSSSLPRKRSFSSSTTHTNATPGTSTSPLLEETLYDDSMEIPYEDMSPYHSGGGGGGGGANSGGSPIDGSPSGDGSEDHGIGLGLTTGSGPSSSALGTGSSVSGMGVLGKPMGTNNFVTKLYQMINDPKSAQFIAWTDLGTSFVVSNVGEFSRSILGSHFKHNNFSSFVRQLNMYGFHKINRTPRAQRTSTDAQTWEFSHHKFLRARPDLLDDIKRKALEPDPSIKQRVELPGEVAAQLGQMRDENRKVWEELAEEKRKVEKLIGVVNHLWDMVGKALPGHLPPFPPDFMEPGDNPNIFITSPTTTHRFQQPLSLSMGGSMHAVHSINSPGSSPTQGEIPLHPKSLSRQQSFQHVTYRSDQSGSTPVTPLPPSPASGSMELYDGDGCGDKMGRSGVKRQRTSSGQSGSMQGEIPPSISGPGSSGKKLSRARSDSAPLGGYGLNVGLNGWQGGTRPRSGSGMVAPRSGMGGVPSIGTMSRGSGGGPPLLSISTSPR